MDDFNYPYTTQKITISDLIEITYVDEGQGDYTLLMLHGLGSYLPAWQKNIEGLKHHFRCIAIDLPNYGKSTKGNFPFTMDFFAKAVETFIKNLQLSNVVLVGHSMGAQIAVTAILERKVPVVKLVLLAPAGFEVFSAEDEAFFRRLITPENIRATTLAQIEQNFALNFSTNKLPDDARFMFEDRLKMRADKKEYDFYCNMIPKCVRSMLESPVFGRLKNINMPTLILFGKEELLIPNKVLHPELTPHQIAASGSDEIPDSELHMIDHCGHFVQWQGAAVVNEHIRNFAL